MGRLFFSGALLVWLATALRVQAAPSITWSDDNSWVRYSDSTILAMGSNGTLNLGQFDAATVAAQQGAGNYTLIRVALSINGSIYGTLSFDNNANQEVTVDLSLFNGYSRATLLGTTIQENYSESQSFSLAADGLSGDAMTRTVDNTGSGEAAKDITSDLAGYIGQGTLSIAVRMNGTWVADGLSTSTTAYDVSGDIMVSLTYYYDYDPVPEPSAFTLLAFGCALIAAKRRIRQIGPL